MITVVRGFKMNRVKLNDFFTTNGGPWIGNHITSRSDQDSISKLFASLDCDCEVKIFLPYVTGFKCPDYLFVCCQWMNVLDSIELDHILQDPVPCTFEGLRNLLQPDVTISRYVVYNTEMVWQEQSPKLDHPAYPCGQCDAVFIRKNLLQLHLGGRHDIHAQNKAETLEG